MALGSARGWHKWVSIVLLVPMFIIGATAIFIAHDKALGTEEVKLAPAMAGNAMNMKMPEVIVRDVAVAGGTTFIASQAGLFRLDAGAPAREPGLPHAEFRSIKADAAGNIFAAGKYGLWQRGASGAWAQRRKGDFHGLGLTPAGIVAYAKDEGTLLSTDGGKNWAEAPGFGKIASLAAREPEAYTLKKLVMDLHTGKFFFGKSAEWIWIDILGATLILLCLTGGWIWWRSQKQKGQEQKSQPA
jgi:hypothetical protein